MRRRRRGAGQGQVEAGAGPGDRGGRGGKMPGPRSDGERDVQRSEMQKRTPNVEASERERAKERVGVGAGGEAASSWAGAGGGRERARRRGRWGKAADLEEGTGRRGPQAWGSLRAPVPRPPDNRVHKSDGGRRRPAGKTQSGLGRLCPQLPHCLSFSKAPNSLLPRACGAQRAALAALPCWRALLSARSHAFAGVCVGTPRPSPAQPQGPQWLLPRAWHPPQHKEPWICGQADVASDLDFAGAGTHCGCPAGPSPLAGVSAVLLLSVWAAVCGLSWAGWAPEPYALPLPACCLSTWCWSSGDVTPRPWSPAGSHGPPGRLSGPHAASALVRAAVPCAAWVTPQGVVSKPSETEATEVLSQVRSRQLGRGVTCLCFQPVPNRPLQGVPMKG